MQLEIDHRDDVFSILNQILELEMAGVVRYTHYSLMIIGYSRIPIVNWMQNQATESLNHATQAGEAITHFNEHPSLKIAELTESYHHDIHAILTESLGHEQQSLSLYYKLLELTKDKSVFLEEYARRLIVEEETHIDEVKKMLMKPGE